MRSPWVTKAFSSWWLAHFLYVQTDLRSTRSTLTYSQVEGQERPMGFTQSFQLRKEMGANNAENWYVFNDIFRLVYSAAWISVLQFWHDSRDFFPVLEHLMGGMIRWWWDKTVGTHG
jgi:aspartyl/asparaginyl-tRNA synthetase